MRSAEEISTIIDKFDLTTLKGVNELEQYVRRELKICEVWHFSGFLHGGTFTSSAGWTRNLCGRVATTRSEDDALTRLWERLLADCWRMVGAASVLHVEGSRPFKWLPTRKTAKNKRVAAITGDIDLFGREDALIYKTYSELTQLVGNAYAARSNTQSALQIQLNAYKEKFGPQGN